ncbi:MULTISPECIES: hypothetical protein [Fibrobacter]|uniref:Uncharacterized protein n=1 Tax=Fibrobacter intestinalis TaxID=28122 RepID=A0A1M6THL5_9BACT|nr:MULTISPECIES: hypothetical protein [Fibrobacter]MDD7299409.1 hypothetical protein [Fibrobacter intestinalis]PBC68267.1 hypothetical protein BGX14_0625 [Fibrobacter sp. UWS1]PBC73565.1 hypothetical protein BGW94_1177 [Fibrobacter sp. NR9]SHK56501.1 hypothetical protein SAMN05720469_1108 [Fibrobacter intestinalis]SJZ63622.1 hypothetical protein SAMN02745108_01187 [Fibrobacter intestinalis]
MHEQIDFSKAVLLQPRKDSWEKVVARIQEKKEKERFIRFRWFSSAALAASALLVAGACFFGVNHSLASSESDYTDTVLNSAAWYSSLGSGESVSTFATAFDTYYSTGE